MRATRESRPRSEGVRGYVDAAIDRELGALGSTSANRNTAANDAAFNVGRIASGAEREGVILDRQTLERRLFEAAEACGYVQKDGTQAARDTIKSGLDAGWKKPRDLSKVGARAGTHPRTPSHAKADPSPQTARTDDAKAAANRRLAGEIIAAATPFRGSLAEKYLEHRGVLVSRLTDAHVRHLRFADNVSIHGGRRLPCVIAMTSNPLTGELNGAIQRTPIKADGTGRATDEDGAKLDKRSLGETKADNGCVVLGDIRPGCDVYEAEGIEDALSALCVAGAGAAAIATLGQSRLGKVELPEGCRRILLGQKKTPADEAAFRKAAQASADAGCETFIVWPGEFGDFNDLLRNENRAAVAEALAAREVATPDTSGLVFLSDMENEPQSVAYLVKGVIERGQIGQIYGQSQVGKTFLAADLVSAVAIGRPWMGRLVRSAPVLYIQHESPSQFKRRLIGMARQLSSDERELFEHRFAMLAAPPHLGKGELGDAGQKHIIEAAKKLARRAGQPVGLIVIDTLMKAIAGDNNNAAEDISSFIRRKREIAAATGAAVLDVHHPNKGNNSGPGGAIQHSADNDVLLSATADGTEGGIAIPLDAVRRVIAEKVKDGESGLELGRYTLRKIELWVDEDGAPVTTCVIEPAAAGAGPSRAKNTRPKPGTKAHEVWNEFNHCQGERISAGHPRIPDGAWIVRYPALEAQCIEKGVGCSNQPDPKERLKVQKRAIERGFNRCVEIGALAKFTLDGELVCWRPDNVQGKGCGGGRGQAGSSDFDPGFDPAGADWGHCGGSEEIEENQSGANRGQPGSTQGQKAGSGSGSTGPAPFRGRPNLTPADDPTSPPGQEGEKVVPFARREV